ncbi:MAG: DUF5030 domain-containing protein [Bacteroidaceae bacterium]
MKRLLLHAISLIVFLVCNAQTRMSYIPEAQQFFIETDTVGIEEMRALWTTSLSSAKKDYSHAEKSPSFQEILAKHDFMGSKVITKKHSLYSCKELKGMEEKLIGYWGVEIIKDKEKLYLKRIISRKDTTEAINIYKKLAKKYGESPEGIPADWVSGQIITMYRESACKYLNTHVSRYQDISKIEKGFVTGICSRISSGLYEREAQRERFTIDGFWADERSIALETFLFSHDVNKAFLKDKSCKPFLSVMLVYIEKNGQASIELLDCNDSLNQIQKNNIKLLQKSVSELPAWNFEMLYDIHGRIFPGRYMLARFFPIYGWRFTDYLNVEIHKTAEGNLSYDGISIY